MATVDIKNAVKAGVLEAYAEQEAAKAHQSLVDFHEENNGSKKDPMQSVLANQATIIELFKQFNDNTSGLGNAASSTAGYGQSGVAQQAMASSQNSLSLGSGISGDMIGGTGSIRTLIINHGVVMTDSGSGVVQGGVSNVGAAQTATPTATTVSDSDDNISYKAGIAGDDTDRAQSKIDNEERKAYQEYTMKPTMTKLSQALDKYLNQDNTSTLGSSGADGGLPGFLGNLIGGAIGAIGGLAVGWLNGLKTQWSKVGKSFVSVWKGATSWIKDSKLGQNISKLGATFKSMVGGLKASVVGKFKGMQTAVGQTLDGMKSSFMKTLTGWKNAIKNSTVGKAASAVKNAVGSLFSKVASGVKSVGKIAANAVAQSPIAKVGQSAVGAAKSAGKIAMGIGKKIPAIQGIGSLVDGAKNSYDIWKKTGNIKDTMSTALAGATDALVNTLAVPEIIGAAKGLYSGAKTGGLKGALKGAGSGIMNAHDANKVSIGQSFAAEVAHLSGNETDTTKAFRKASMYGLTKDQVGLANINGNAAGFGTAAALYQGDRKLAAGSTINTNEPNATTGDGVSGARKSDAEKNKEITSMMKDAFIEAMTSEEVKNASVEQAKATGDAINGRLMG